MRERAQFRVLYRDFLFRMVDLEVLAARGDIQKLLGQFAALLGALSFVLALMIVPGYASSRLPRAQLLIAAWGDEEFLIGINIAVVGLFAVIAWNAVLPDRRDALVLGPLPVRLRTIFVAKIAAIATALGVSVGAVNAFTGLAFGFLAIPSDSGALGLARSFSAYWLTMIAAGVFVFSALLAMQGLAAQVVSYAVFLRLSSFLQLTGFFAILGIFFLTPPLASVKALADPANRRILEFLPSFWFLGLFHRLNGSMHAVFVPLAARAIRNTAIAFTVAAASYALAYFRQVRKIVEQPDIAPGSRNSLRLGSRVVGALLTRPLDRAILLFTARTIARSRQHRFLLAVYGGFGLAVALAYAKSLIYGYSREPWDQLNSPLLVGGFVVLLFAIVGARAIFALPAALPANWVFKITAVHSPLVYFRAVRRALYLLTAVPMWIAAALFYLAIWPGRPAVEHVAVLVCAGVFIAEQALDGFRKIPFTCSYLPGSGNLTVRLGIYAILFLLLAEILIGQIEFTLLHRVSQFLLFATLLAAAAAWRRWRTTSHAAVMPEIQFEEKPPSEVFALDLSLDARTTAPQSYVDAVEPSRIRAPKLAAVAAAALLFFGWSYEKFGEWRDARRNPQIGHAIDIGGRRMNIFCSGQGSPAVIFESGPSMPGFDWALVQPEIAAFTQACWYDRAGLGWSDAGPYPSASESAARDLHALLGSASIEPPYILVGHAGGGYDARVYRAMYTSEVAGMVLVDASQEDTAHASMPRFVRLWAAGALDLAARFGLLRLLAPTPDPAPPQFSREQWAEIWTLRWEPKAVLAAARDDVSVSAAQVRAMGTFGDLPLIVLTAGQRSGVDQDLWNELQAELAWRSARGRQVIVPNTGHMIPEQAPEAVTEAVYEIFSEIRTRPVK